jgi:hypothetical protein
MIHAGIAAAFGALCGGAYWVAGAADPAPAAPPAPAQVRPVQETGAPATSALAETGLNAAATEGAPAAPAGADSAVAPLTRITVQGRAAPARAAVWTKQSDTASAPAAAPRIAVTLAGGEAMAAEVTGPAGSPPSSLTQSRASTATLKDFRKTLEQGREAVRDVVQLGTRRKPGRNASPEELHQFRIRQQNAEAARNYRTYLDTLARLMRGKPSESTARQSLERARQTLTYLNAMLADSQASLR